MVSNDNVFQFIDKEQLFIDYLVLFNTSTTIIIFVLW